MHHDDLAARFAACGWEVLTAAGNDADALLKAFERARKAKGRPAVVIADTIKGCGVSFMENAAEWHHKVPTQEEYNQIISDFAAKKEAALHE